MANHRLTPAQQEFCRRLVAGDTQADAYAAAYPKAAAWQKCNVRTQASKLARRPYIRTTVSAMQQAKTEAVIVERVRTLKEIARLALFDPRGVVHMDGPNKGRFKTLEELDEQTAAGIASFKIGQDGTIEYKFHNKVAALEQAAKHLGLFERDNDQKKDPLASLLASLAGNVIGVTKDVGSAITIDDEED